MADVAGEFTWVRTLDSFSNILGEISMQYDALPTLHQSRESVAKRRVKPAKSLITLLQSHHLALTNDGEDRIYALMNLTFDCQSSSPPIDYECSKWKTHLKVLEWLIGEHGSLDFLVTSYAYNCEEMHLAHRSTYTSTLMDAGWEGGFEVLQRGVYIYWVCESFSCEGVWENEGYISVSAIQILRTPATESNRKDDESECHPVS
ncbi:hypothetical protein BDZ45DRAFT_753401 [Acephala macrosclerotiorum]|nr:hypothetical protein BDZ45DRAFT_753401 [Acephala macrosclerotiorum]